MGGGDLNLKKSWHPSTLRNIERVWKAEQKHEAEKQKIEQLQKELAAERAREEIHAYAEEQGVLKKKEERLDWLYQGPAALVNRDDYLLGRKIDKTLELLQSQENGSESKDNEGAFVGSVFRPEASTSNVTVDLATKIREDPLFAIMKKEKEQRKTLLSNPVRMKQLKAILENSLGKKKSSKKDRKRKPSSSSSSSDSESEEEERNSKRRRAPDDRSRKHSNSKHYKSSRSNSMPHKNHKSHDYEVSKDKAKYRHRDSHNNRGREERTHDSSKRRDRNRSEVTKPYKRNRDHFSNDRRSKPESRSKPEPKKKIDEAERARLLQEMVDNAKWREDQRKRNVKRYVKEGEREDDIGDGDASKFIRPMITKATENGSVENRVKQKIFTNQKGFGHMDSNFIRR